MADNTRVAIAKLSNSNYQVWQYKLQMLLIKEDLWEVVTADEPVNPDAAWLRKDGKARATIGLLVEDNQLVHVRSETTAKGAWESLRHYHQKSTLTSKVFLLKRLCRMTLGESGNMETHINSMLDLVYQLTSLGEDLADHLVVALMLCSLPDSYDTLITALESRPEEDLTLELVKSKLVHEFKRRQESMSSGSRSSAGTSETVSALKTQQARNYGVTSERKGKCHYCQKPGHYKRECRKLQADKTRNDSKDNKVKKITKDSDGPSGGEENPNGTFYVCFKAGNKQLTNSWFIDSGATCHMSNNRSFFTDFVEVDDKVFLADNTSSNVQGKGSGVLKCIDGNGTIRDIIVTDVLYVPNLDGNLLSVKMLVSRGLQVSFDQDGCKIQKDNVIVATAGLEGPLYKLRELSSIKALFSQHKGSLECIHVWHRRFGHRNPEGIKLLVNKSLATGIQISSCETKQVCGNCIEGKMLRLPFPKQSTSQSNSVLDLVHTDLCGPMQTMTPGGKRYVLTFIDDYSRFTVIYLLAQKSEVLEKLKEYVQMVETQFNLKLKVLRSDRGGEYVGDGVKKFLGSKGIKQENTAPYTPQQNGIAERKNRTLTEMARCMLFDAHLQNRFWGEAVVTANYLQNRLPTRAKEKTPFELWHGTVPEISHLRIFGCPAYAHIPKELRRKLDKKAVKLIFVGYEPGSKAYRLLDTLNNRVTISRDVQFDEGTSHLVETVQTTESQDPVPDLETEDVQELATTTDTPWDCYTELGDIDVQSEQDQTHNDRPRRSSRSTKGQPPKRLVLNVNNETKVIEEPRTAEEALSGAFKDHWRVAMEKELASLQENEVWEVTDLPKGQSAVGSKWVFKHKYDSQGNISRFKARLVAQGFSQKFGTNYDEVFAPVGKQATFRVLLTVAGHNDMSVRHYDIKTAFLYGKLQEQVYMKQPAGFVLPGEETKVCKLKRSIYGLKQSARVWNDHINDVLIQDSFQRGIADTCLYSKMVNGQWVYVLLYVDDIIVVSKDGTFIDRFGNMLSERFQISDLGNLNMYLGIQIERDQDGIFLVNQEAYIRRILERFGLETGKTAKTPMETGYMRPSTPGDEEIADKEVYRQAIGCLLYVAINTRPDIAVSVSILSRKISQPTMKDWIAVKRILRYLKGSISYKLKLGDKKSSSDSKLTGFADADWAGDTADRKSNTGYLFLWCGGTISWSSRKQNCVALSSTEAEYIALAEACQEAIWLEKLFQDLHIQIPTTTVYEDNQSCLKMLENEKASQRTKHIDTKYHFVRDLKATDQIEFRYCPTETMIADILTKPLEATKTNQLAHLAGLQ